MALTGQAREGVEDLRNVLPVLGSNITIREQKIETRQ